MVNEHDHIVKDRINSFETMQVQGHSEVRAITDRNWELPVILFQEAGYSEDQIAVGLEYRYTSDQRQGEPRKTVHFLGILPPIEEVPVREPYSGTQHSKEEVEE